MEEKTQAQDEISLSEILKLFLRKIKVLVLALLVGAFVGAGLGFVTTFNVETYGSTIEFYVNPRLDRDASSEIESQYGVYGAYGRHVMDNMVRLLSSELFAEQLLLNPETGLPFENEANPELNEKIAVAKEAQKTASQKIANAQNLSNTLSETNTLVSETNTELNAKWATYRNAKLSEDATINLSSSPALIKKENGDSLNEDEIEINDLYNLLTKYKEDVKTLKESLKTANAEANSAAATADEKEEEAIELWRETDELYEARLTAIMKSAKYSYYNEDEVTDKVEDLARSFIYVEISVLNGEDFAKGLRNRIIEVVPEFVEDNMAIPSGYDGTNCQRITRSDAIVRTNSGAMLSAIVKYAMLLAIVALIVACVAVIIIERSDKRLRSLDQVTETFNVPVLGVIPKINVQGTEKNQTTQEAK